MSLDSSLTFKICATACIMVIAGTCSIATSSIGVSAYDEDNYKLKNRYGSSYSFLVLNLICAMLLVICGCSLSSYLITSSYSSNTVSSVVSAIKDTHH